MQKPYTTPASVGMTANGAGKGMTMPSDATLVPTAATLAARLATVEREQALLADEYREHCRLCDLTTIAGDARETALEADVARLTADLDAVRAERDAVQAQLAALLDFETATKCGACGGPHAYDTSVPSPLWNRVVRATGLSDHLCASCILLAFVRADEGFTAELYGDAVDRQGADVPVISVQVGMRPIVDGYGDMQAGRDAARALLVRVAEHWEGYGEDAGPVWRADSPTGMAILRDVQATLANR